MYSSNKKIKASLTRIDDFSRSNSDCSRALCEKGRGNLAKCKKIENELDRDIQELTAMLARAERVAEEVAVKMEKYRDGMNEASKRISEHQATIDYWLAHPWEKTVEDKDGNKTTVKEYNEEAISRATTKRNEAQDDYDEISKKYERAAAIKEKLDDFISRNGKLREIICKVLEAVKMNNREMEQYLVVMGDEAEHNYESLRRVMDALRHYEASPSFSSLPRVDYGDFSAH